ncbi:MAG: RnfH family protein [Proteobacteria bacterium]|nr:RnfH family protein [Pseudomonadota bacterium]NBX86427.1 RnfH family protein [Pseudomonadota bacterium]
MNTPKQTNRLSVQVVAVAGGIQFIKPMLVPRSQTVGWCANASGVYSLHPQLQGAKLGIWGKLTKPNTVVEEGDRIEIYTPATSKQKSKKMSEK